MHSIIYLLVFISSALSLDNPCNKLKTTYGYVCACNSSYCDTINPPKKLRVGEFHFYYTSNSTPGFNYDTGKFTKTQHFPYALNIKVNPSKTYQTIKGFGGAFTDLFGSAFNTLPQDSQDKLIRSFFSEEGIEYTMCRVVWGSSDFSLRNYSYLPYPDLTLKSFNLTNDDHTFKIPQIKWALRTTKRPIYFLGSTWTAPPWMKTNNDTTSGFLIPEYRQIWADYYVKTLDAFKNEGIEFWGVTTGNEPITLYFVKTVPNLAIFPEEQREWVLYNLGPALKNSNYNLEIIFLDDMRAYINWWMETVMRDPSINNYSIGVGLHWYMDMMSDPMVLDEMHKRYPKLDLVYTESSVNVILGNVNSTMKMDQQKPFGDAGHPKLGYWIRAAMYANSIIENLNHWVSTYMDWNLGLNTMGGPNLLNSSCDASIIIEENTDVFYKQPIYYVMGHFSKFLAPGSIVIDTKAKFREEKNTKNSSQDNKKWSPHISHDVQFVGVSNPDGSKAIVLYNPKPFAVRVSVDDTERGFAPLILEADSVSTILYW